MVSMHSTIARVQLRSVGRLPYLQPLFDVPISSGWGCSSAAMSRDRRRLLPGPRSCRPPSNAEPPVDPRTLVAQGLRSCSPAARVGETDGRVRSSVARACGLEVLE